MILAFTPLATHHFPVLLRWLETPHVKAWWPTDKPWTWQSVEEKYQNYVEGFKIENGVAKEIHAFVICVNQQPVGYIQHYNVYDFSREYPLENLPNPLMAFDMFIGEAGFLGRGIGTQALIDFLQLFCKDSAVFADPDVRNEAAIRTYQKAGFKMLKKVGDNLWMIRDRP